VPPNSLAKSSAYKVLELQTNKKQVAGSQKKTSGYWGLQEEVKSVFVQSEICLPC
jgi:hypothetical protein